MKTTEWQIYNLKLLPLPSLMEPISKIVMAIGLLNGRLVVVLQFFFDHSSLFRLGFSLTAAKAWIGSVKIRLITKWFDRIREARGGGRESARLESLLFGPSKIGGWKFRCSRKHNQPFGVEELVNYFPSHFWYISVVSLPCCFIVDQLSDVVSLNKFQLNCYSWGDQGAFDLRWSRSGRKLRDVRRHVWGKRATWGHEWV